MPTFPRTAGALPRLATPPQFVAGVQNWAQSGRGQFRSIHVLGRIWEEIYPNLNLNLAAVQTLLTNINSGWLNGTVWDIQHPYWHQRKGSGSGAVTVSGANQVGSSLVVSGGGGAGWLLAGDLIQVAGCPVIFDVTADMTGTSPIPIYPPILPGHSPTDGAVVTHAPASIFFKAVLVKVDMPPIDSTKYITPGLALQWREQPGG